MINIYAALILFINILPGLDVSVAEITILTVAMLFAHNLLVESAISRSAGVSFLFTCFYRLASAFFACWILNLIYSKFNYLQEPFIFLSCDTLVKELIPEPDRDWMGFSKIRDLAQYRTLKVTNGDVNEICEKDVIKENLKGYIGLAGVYNYEKFWHAMHAGGVLAINQGEAYGMKSILESNNITANAFTWFDAGNIESIKITREVYAEKGKPNIIEKENEAIWFIKNNVIKFSADIDFISNRIKRAKELKGFVPNINAYKTNMYCYEKINGEVLSNIINPAIFELFLEKCKNFWLKKILSLKEKKFFENNCLDFYKKKTLERVELFYKNFNKKDNATIINGELIPSLQDLFNQIDWNWLSRGLAGRFHGDFHFENILYSKYDKKFIFLDWRQDFAGDLLVGDIYYDLAKLMQMYLQNGVYAGERYLSEEVVKEFTKCQFPKNENRRGAGFDKAALADQKGGPASKNASPEGFGHTGFTGALVWADPKTQIVYVFLSNRIHPDANNKKLAGMDIRTNILEVIYNSLND